MRINDLIKFKEITKLQTQVTAKGICSSCHQKTLKFIAKYQDLETYQCSLCSKVFIINSNED